VHVPEASFEWIALEDCRRAGFPEKDIDRVAGRIDLVRACLTELNPKGETDRTVRRALFPCFVQQLNYMRNATQLATEIPCLLDVSCMSRLGQF
jgi:hypothetical protein